MSGTNEETTSAPTALSIGALNSNTDGGNKFQHAISAWRTVDLTTLTTNLDTTASDIVTYQRDSTVQRKDLAQKTKDFRKLDDSAKLTEVKGLLKAYQTFIDLLTNHSKSVNSAFLQAYSAISEAPDPYPLLEASVDAILISEETVPKLSEENKHLHETVSKLTVQLEDTESKLQSETTSRREIETGIETRVKEVESTWTAALNERTDNWVAKEKTLKDKVENQERLLSELKATYEVNQRLGKSGDELEATRSHVSSSELALLHSDLERTSVRLAEVETRNEQMRLELAQTKSNATAPTQTSLQDDPGYMRMRSENSSLMRKLDSSRLEKDSLKRDLDARLRTTEREISALKEEKELLKTKVQKCSDYDEIKQELDVLKSIEFSTGDDDEVPITDGDDNDEDKRNGNSLEKLLLGRNKKLSDELTILRVSHQDLQAKLNNVESNLSTTRTELERAQTLNDKLEVDLETLQAEGANAFPSGASVAGTYVTRAQTRKGKISPTSSIISGLDPRAGPERDFSSGSAGILPMVTAQRDRFKNKNSQLEQELSENHRVVQQLRQEVAALQKDNLTLYEKARYVNTYNRTGATVSSSSAYAANPNPSTVSMGRAASPGMDQYRKAYESNISPFAAFRGRESARAYRRMSLPERVVYSITRMVLASRTSRNLFAAYCVALHILVFLSLYWLGSADLEKHATSLGSSAAAAAAAARGKGASSDHGNWKEDGFDR